MDAIELQEAIRPKIWAVQADSVNKCHLFIAVTHDQAASKCGVVASIRMLRDPSVLIKCKTCLKGDV